MRTGQFYMIGVVLITGLILGVVGLQGGVVISGGAVSSNEVLFNEYQEGIVDAVQASMARGDNSSVIERDLTGYLLFQRHVGAAHAFEPQSMVLVGRVNSTGIELSFGNGWGERLESVWISAGSTDTRLGTVDSKAFVHEYVPETGSPVTVTVNSSVGGMERTVQRNSFVLARTRAEIEDSVWAGTILG